MVVELRLCVPVDASWERHVPPEHVPAALCLLHIINQRQLGWHVDRDGFVALKCAYLRRLVGRDELTPVRRSLESAGVIDWRKDYVRGTRSMRYRIRGQFQPPQLVTSRDPALLRRVKRVYVDEDRRLLPVHRWLKSKLAALTLDVDRSRSIVSGMVPAPDSWLDVDSYRQLLDNQITAFADQLDYGDVRLTCDEYGRVHTPLTNMPKSLRCCVSSTEGPLQGIDLSNSQPLFCGLVALKYVNSSKHGRCKLRSWKPSSTPYERQPKAANHSQCSNTMAELAQPIVISKGYDDRLREPADLREYLRLCISGQLYEALMPPTADRSEFKRAVFRDVFFGADRHPSAVRDAFAARFPTVTEVMRALKSENYCRLAWLMQHRESTLFIGRICRRLNVERPSMPLVTVHDSLVTTDEHLRIVRSVADDEFRKLEVTPTFKIEPWV